MSGSNTGDRNRGSAATAKNLSSLNSVGKTLSSPPNEISRQYGRLRALIFILFPMAWGVMSSCFAQGDFIQFRDD